jgi:cobalt-precorrin-5B (C1)-methyltransferase
MSGSGLREFDMTAPADNGLRRGRTTGTCATAAVKAALLLLHSGERNSFVQVALPGGEFCMTVPVKELKTVDDGSVRADVVKDAGDDPDQTDKATIFAIVRPNGLGAIRFIAGEGVGTVTEPGISVPIGDPAINPVPREMMRVAVEEVCGSQHGGFDLTIGCEGGEQITKKTFNPRLGIVGGISILGTTGVVEPMSLAAYQASIEVYIRVALAGEPEAIAFRPGNIGITFSRDRLNLPPKRVVHTSNFIGFSLDAANRILAEEHRQLQKLWVVGHPGKLAKILDNVWDTHSRNSGMAMTAVAGVAADCGFDSDLVERIAACNTTEAVLDLQIEKELAAHLWCEVEKRVAAKMQERVPNAHRIEVRLFSMNGTPLGEAANV